MDPLNHLRKCCKLKLTHMGTETSDFGSALPLEGQPDVLLRIANEDTCVVPGEPLSSTVVHRVLLTGAHMYRDVAWVVDADAKICMSCHKKRFGMFTWKHHCRLCGNIVCDACSFARIHLERQFGLEEGSSGSRACNTCMEGQKKKSAAHTSSFLRSMKSNVSAGGAGHSDSNKNTDDDNGNGGTEETKQSNNAIAGLEKEVRSVLYSNMGSGTGTGTGTPPVTGYAIAAADLEAPTPEPKAAAAAMSYPKGILKKPLQAGEVLTYVGDNGADNAFTSNSRSSSGSAITGRVIPIDTTRHNEETRAGAGVVVSPMSALLDKVDKQGRWDRSDDGMSTPGSVTSIFSTHMGDTSPSRNGGVDTPSSPSYGYGYSNGTGTYAVSSSTGTTVTGTGIRADGGGVEEDGGMRGQQLASHNARLNAVIGSDPSLTLLPISSSEGAASSDSPSAYSPLPDGNADEDRESCQSSVLGTPVRVLVD